MAERRRENENSGRPGSSADCFIYSNPGVELGR
ncbi:hypothetical protein COLO4_36174 [Corchorus olitorius]|uniref:Uncharacterized protein n=1 Tax=Corchorus olitorius TaxID=93759 RepID=A0A1R3GAR1_9ROSI|nr:hypothetical protein COLO4_36174 [Corchorus olitorius]